MKPKLVSLFCAYFLIAFVLGLWKTLYIPNTCLCLLFSLARVDVSVNFKQPSSKNVCNYQIYHDTPICRSFNCKRKVYFHGTKVEISHKNAVGPQSFKEKAIQIWGGKKKVLCTMI